MERLLRMALKKCDGAEVYRHTRKALPVEFEKGEIKQITLANYPEIGLRILKNGRIGFSYGTSLKHRSAIVREAIRSIKGGPVVKFDFPGPSVLPRVDNYDANLEQDRLKDLMRDSSKVIRWFKKKGLVDVVGCYSAVIINSIDIINSKGLDVHFKQTGVIFSCSLMLEGSGTGPVVYNYYSTYRPLDAEQLNKLYETYLLGKKQVDAPTRKMKVIFAPTSMNTINWRVASAISGQSLIDKITPLEQKLGEQIAHKDLTLIEDPHKKDSPFSRPFDDEGVPTRVIPIIERGIFKNFIYDIRTAMMLGTESTGNGYKLGMWGGDITTPVNPYPRHLVFQPGDVDLEEMIRSIDEGILLEEENGAHSGNIPAGEFSINVGLGYYIKDGVLQGRTRDTMISGNIYELFKNLLMVSRNVDSNGQPWLLFDNVSVVGLR